MNSPRVGIWENRGAKWPLVMTQAYSNVTEDEPVQALVEITKAARLGRQVVFQALHAKPVAFLKLIKTDTAPKGT